MTLQRPILKPPADGELAIYSQLTVEYRHPRAEPFVMSDMSKDHLKPVLRISFPGRDRLGHGKMELLEHIKETGSISAAGRAMDMSYRRAWLLVAELNRMFLQPSVESQRGGQKGGGAALTEFGEELLVRFRAMEASINEALADDLGWLDANRRPPEQPDDL